MKGIAKVLIVGLLILTICTFSKSVVHAASSGVCPAVGQDTDCGILITITTTGASLSLTGQGPYDGTEDTLIGVINKSSQPIRTLELKSALPIFGFDGDGIDTFGISGNTLDTSGYGGPNVYFTNINSSLTDGMVNFITPIAASTGTGYFSLEEQIGNAVSCQDVINNSVKFQTSGPAIDATFMPMLKGTAVTFQQAEQDCGFVNFDWVQKFTHLPDPSPYYARNDGSPIHITSAWTPFNDPPAGGGYTYETSPDNSFPFYYDPLDDLKTHEPPTVSFLTFRDRASDPCLPDASGNPSPAYTANLPTGDPFLHDTIQERCAHSLAPKGSFLGFTTHLAGINSDGTATDLGIGFDWTTTFNGTSGGTATTKNELPVDPGSGTGGVTVTNVQNTTNYQYNGITVTTVNGNPVGAGPAPSTVAYTGPTVIANTHPATLSAKLTTDGTAPISNRTVTLTLGTGSIAQSCTGTTDATGSASCSLMVSQPLGASSVAASFAGDASYLPSSASASTVIFAYTSGGAFVVGDQSVGPLAAAVGKPITFWGAQWAKVNSLSGGPAPNSFKGFENSVLQPICSTAWTTSTGNSSNPPSSIPSYTAMIVSNSITQSGSMISGNTPHVVIVKVDPGYASDPGHAGTGTVVAVLC